MKAKIKSVKHYYAETEDGKTYDVDINNDILKRIIDKDEFIEGNIVIDEKQDQYTDGTYARSYTVTKTFVPKIEITRREGKFLQETKITTERIIPNVPKEERYNEDFKTKGFWKEPKEPKITLPDVDPNKIRHMNEGTEPKKIKIKKD